MSHQLGTHLRKPLTFASNVYFISQSIQSDEIIKSLKYKLPVVILGKIYIEVQEKF